MNNLTVERLKEVLDYNSDTGVFTWVITPKCLQHLKGKIAGCFDKKGYVIITIDSKCYKAHRLAWMYMYGEMPNKSIDHINQNTSDNSIKNLREVNAIENGKNRRICKNNTSGYTNIIIFTDKRNGNKRWLVKIKVSNNKVIQKLFLENELDKAIEFRNNTYKKYKFSNSHGK